MVKTERDGISMQEFIRTRDSVVTGLTKLNGAISTLIEAFVSHTNNLLSTEGQAEAVLDTNTLNEFLAQAGLGREPLKFPASKEKKKRVKKEKDPNAPKRPLTAFFLFSGMARDHVREDLGANASPVEVNAEILRRWSAMDETQKMKWKNIYAVDYAKYKIQVAEYKAKTGNDIAAEEVASDDEVPEVEALSDAGVGAVEESEVEEAEEEEEDEEEEESEDEPELPIKEPTPPPAKKAKAGKRKVKGAAALPAASPSPSAQLMAKETAIPFPGEKVSAKKRKDASPEEPKKKKARKSKTGGEETEIPVPTPDAKKKKKNPSRKAAEGF